MAQFVVDEFRKYKNDNEENREEGADEVDDMLDTDEAKKDPAKRKKAKTIIRDKIKKRRLLMEGNGWHPNTARKYQISEWKVNNRHFRNSLGIPHDAQYSPFSITPGMTEENVQLLTESFVEVVKETFDKSTEKKLIEESKNREGGSMFEAAGRALRKASKGEERK